MTSTTTAAVYTVSAYGPAGSSARVRLSDWVDHLDIPAQRIDYRGAGSNRPSDLLRHGGQVVAAERRLRELDPAGATVLLSREASPFSSGGIESRLLHRAGHGVYDLDDAVFLASSPARRVFSVARKSARAAAAADVVIAGNDYLADWASAHNTDVRVIPSCVEPSAYLPKTTWEIEGTPTLVWLGSHSTEQYVAQLSPALAEVHRRTGARLRLVSSPIDNPALADLEPFLDRVPWSATGVAQALHTADIAIGPLADTPWTRGKCAYKLLQYGATALPFVASPVGANAAVIATLAGIAATSHDEWVDALTTLAGNPADRSARGSDAWIGARERYSFAAWAQRWSEACLVTR